MNRLMWTEEAKHCQERCKWRFLVPVYPFGRNAKKFNKHNYDFSIALIDWIYYLRALCDCTFIGRYFAIVLNFACDIVQNVPGINIAVSSYHRRLLGFLKKKQNKGIVTITQCETSGQYFTYVYKSRYMHANNYNMKNKHYNVVVMIIMFLLYIEW